MNYETGEKDEGREGAPVYRQPESDRLACKVSSPGQKRGERGRCGFIRLPDIPKKENKK